MPSFTINTDNYKDEIKAAVEKNLYLLDENINKNKDIFIQNYKEQIIKIINDLVSLQKENKIEAVSTLAFILSRINIDNEILKYKVYVYGKEIYIDTYDYYASIDVSNIYEFFIKLKNDLHKEIKKYLGIIAQCNVNSDLYGYLKYYNMYFVNLLREIFSLEEIKLKLKNLNKYPNFYIIQNEIYEKPYLILSLNDKE